MGVRNTGTAYIIILSEMNWTPHQYADCDDMGLYTHKSAVRLTFISSIIVYEGGKGGGGS